VRRALLEELLDSEVALLTESLGRTSSIRVWREKADILIEFDADRTGSPGLFRFGCERFDAEPPSVSMLDPITHEELPIERWTPGVAHSIHPGTSKPFICLQGIAEYHTHPSHLDDRWDRYRYRFRVPQTASRLLDKAGVVR
jgi:hypothetical protein